MMRRRAVAVRPARGIVGTMATTAVVAGTATAVSGGVAHRQQQKVDQQASEQQQQMEADQAAAQSQADMEQMKAQMAQMQAQQVQSAAQPGAIPATGGDMMAQLQKLSEMKQAGLLTDEEFASAKAKLLGG